MRKRPTHLYGPSVIHTYTTVCGLSLATTYADGFKDTLFKKAVTCKRCKKTKRFKNHAM